MQRERFREGRSKGGGPPCRATQISRVRQCTNLAAGREERRAKGASFRRQGAEKRQNCGGSLAFPKATHLQLKGLTQRPAPRRRTEFWAQRCACRRVHVTARLRNPRRRDLFRSQVSGTSRFLLASAFRPPSLFRLSCSPSLSPPSSPEDIRGVEPVLVCLSHGHQIKFLYSKALYFF